MNFLFKAGGERMLGLKEVVPCLEVQPELGLHPKKVAEPEGRIGRDGPLALNDFANPSLGNADVFRQSVLGDAHRFEEFLQEDLTRMYGLKVALTHIPISMIVHNLDVISIAVLPHET